MTYEERVAAAALAVLFAVAGVALVLGLTHPTADHSGPPAPPTTLTREE